MTSDRLIGWIADARDRTLALVSDLDDDQIMGPRLDRVNPLRWEIGHVAWFQEKWVLRHAAGLPPIDPRVDRLYDSASIPHDARWDLPLLSRQMTIDYLCAVRDRVLDEISRDGLAPEPIYFNLLALFHEDMHTEAFTYTRQTLGYPAPRFSDTTEPRPALQCGAEGPLKGDAVVPGGTFLLGATPDLPFVFDNEKGSHLVEVRSFRIARAPVTQSEYAAFVEDGGYRRKDLWSEAGWKWREARNTGHPLYWRPASNGWERRDFDRWASLEPHRPVLHVSWHEADAYCRWAGRRLPTETEWEVAASAEPDAAGTRLGDRKRRFPWGDEPPSPERAHLDWRAMGCLDVGALPQGDSAFGCRQMIGNVWEWTSSDFLPYPGFAAGPYREYSEPWFGDQKVLRGGCWATRSRLIRNTWRNFYRPERNDVWAGFRTCAMIRETP